ncbi:uncharacterized protein LOC111372761 [Olea europaea var. sylvestris]|uniref:uncharacterized protein LOC111372761 n=1 Tax=Olea europaea var. sylvestris TaxID=158386 RepID=UPI000C1D5CD0|nr:uncharacterized protein LOC111372761 [Olea europaea var. sylvestris]
MVMEVVHEDIGAGNMQCIDHPYKNSTPDLILVPLKLGKLVSSSFPLPISSSTSSSSSPSFRSDFSAASATATATKSLQVCRHASSSARLPFIWTQRKNKNKDGAISDFKRSKSTTTSGRGIHFLDEKYQDYSLHKRGFWSFLYFSKHSSTSKKIETRNKDLNFSSSSVSGTMKSRDKEEEEVVGCEESESPRMVSRSRSVGCGSRSFSGDFFERISTGFGDCTLRRVESHRESKSKLTSVHKNGVTNGQVQIKERVRCAGIFSGFSITSSSSSSSSSSHRASSSTEGTAATATVGNLSDGRSKSWGWTFASPMRAFSKPLKRDSSSSNKNATPNLAAIPSLLTVGG